MDLNKKALALHKKLRGKLEVKSKIKLSDKDSLSLAYTPGVAAPSREIAKNKALVYEYTTKGNLVGVISDGSAVLGLGNIGPEAALPVMEGKAAILKEFADVDAFPICLDTQDTDEIVRTVKAISPVFGAINLEDISAPRCFEIEKRLQNIGIPVFHDDQHGTAIVVLAALQNAVKATGKKLPHLRIIISGAGAAGTAIAKLLSQVVHPKQLVVCDSKGIIYKGRPNLEKYKVELANLTKQKAAGSLADALVGADVFIGVSAPNTLTSSMIKTMKEDPIIFAMANPDPEIMPAEALKAGAAIVATGRSDLPNQINNSLAYPGIFRGALDARVKSITPQMKLAASKALAGLVKKPASNHILPTMRNPVLVKTIARAVRRAAQ